MSPGAPAAGPIPILEGEAAEGWVAGLARRGRSPAGPDVEPILARVREGGDAALLELTEALDGARPTTLRVDAGRCVAALRSLPGPRRRALERAASNIERFHAAQRRREPAIEVEPGVRAWREFRPIRRVGIYAPGGRASYPTSLLMAAVPARLARCPEVVACSPPGPDGEPAPSVLAAAALAGVHEMYAVGGAQAVGAMAYGTESIGSVDKIFGPGNAWVNAAKMAVAATVAVDLPAGPSEVLVWADGGSPAGWTAAELLAQAEHGPDSLCIAILPDRRTADAVRDALRARLGRLARREPAGSALAASAVLVTADEGTALRWIEAVAPEHLALIRRDARRVAGSVGSAGSIFLGPWSTVAAGDYLAGPNHVLPTGGRARAEGGLSLDDFGRWIQLQQIDREGLERLAPAIETLAEWEGLPAHAAAARGRLHGDEGTPAEAGRPEAGGRTREAADEAREAAARLLRPALAEAAPYVTARSLHAGGILLDANENPFGPLASEADEGLHRYPEPSTPGLRSRLSRRLGVPPEALWIGNGSDEAIDLLLRATCAAGDACVVPVPTYGVYAARAQVMEVEVREVALDEGFDLDVAATSEAAAGARLVLLCSPNNPTGNRLSEERILELAGSVRCLVAVDEAYVEFAPGPSLAAAAASRPGLAVLRTLSKAWGLAGARVGCLIAHPELVRLLRRAGLPYPLSAPAARAAERALDRADEMVRRRDLLVAERERLRAGLEALGLRTLPSEANFLLFFVDEPAAVQARLAARYGVVVRDRSGLARLEGGLRVSVGTPSENDAFLEGLAATLGGRPASSRAGGGAGAPRSGALRSGRAPSAGERRR